ncbi:NADP oxidoreductase [Kitasatospora sp. MMS16-BH015]|uniref:NADPH-dependent F420 reductase n=1 Tax=Kitasatospora sp. MMS16-BH015 TaxID=2018025 RepID=UPI000CA2A2BB|nr:NAD(P)-binding domain-containing protein [Kitasatospora sp. MMS16-BH015]AUG81531.1 NADP oxidoreductase [Kitasatospora sp. MMS16-BH015]
MHFGIIGTGTVGRTLASKLVSLGHEVTLGSRTKENETALAWAEQAGPYGHSGTFAEAAQAAEVVLNATSGTVSLQALRLAGAENLAGKVLIDVSNPLVFSATGELSLDPVNTDSVAEQIQREYPEARVVKALNTVNCAVMVDPGRVPGEHNLFVAGNDPVAKAQVTAVLEQFGWPAGSVLDLGGVEAARGLEMLMPFWLRMMGQLGHADFNYQIRRAQ